MRYARWTPWGACLCASLLGCYPHRTLPRALPSSADFGARLSMYNTYRPRTLELLVATNQTSGESWVRSTRSVTLANGVSVYRPEDLLPLVDERSNYAEGVRQTAARERVSYGVGYTGVGIMGAGGLLFGIGMGTAGRSLQDGPPPLAIAGLVAIGVGAIVALTTLAVSVNDERQAAFRGFDAALRHRLALCGETPNLVDCAPVEPAPPVSAEGR